MYLPSRVVGQKSKAMLPSEDLECFTSRLADGHDGHPSFPETMRRQLAMADSVSEWIRQMFPPLYYFEVVFLLRGQELLQLQVHSRVVGRLATSGKTHTCDGDYDQG
jgi:hypothetical protein